MNETYPYPYSAAEARKRNELSLWRESHRANIACRDAIEDEMRCWLSISLVFQRWYAAVLELVHCRHCLQVRQWE